MTEPARTSTKKQVPTQSEVPSAQTDSVPKTCKPRKANSTSRTRTAAEVQRTRKPVTRKLTKAVASVSGPLPASADQPAEVSAMTSVTDVQAAATASPMWSSSLLDSQAAFETFLRRAVAAADTTEQGCEPQNSCGAAGEGAVSKEQSTESGVASAGSSVAANHRLSVTDRGLHLVGIAQTASDRQSPFRIRIGHSLLAGCRRFMQRLRVVNQSGPRKQLRVIETLSLGSRKQLMLVSCAGERFLIGSGAESVHSIMRIRPESEQGLLRELGAR